MFQLTTAAAALRLLSERSPHDFKTSDWRITVGVFTQNQMHETNFRPRIVWIRFFGARLGKGAKHRPRNQGLWIVRGNGQGLRFLYSSCLCVQLRDPQHVLLSCDPDVRASFASRSVPRRFQVAGIGRRTNVNTGDRYSLSIELARVRALMGVFLKLVPFKRPEGSTLFLQRNG